MPTSPEHGSTERLPEPGPAPVGPAVQMPAQTPAKTPEDPGAAPVGPAVRPEDQDK